MLEYYETTSVAAFVQFLAAHCLPHGYRYYVLGLMPEGKDYYAIDERIVAKYDIPKNRSERYHRRFAGEVVIRYLRFKRWYLLIATGPWGKHRFFECESDIRDVRTVPIRFHGYELCVRGGRVRVGIAKKELAGIRKRLLRLAKRERVSKLIDEFQSIPFEPYRAVLCQLFALRRKVNRRRKAARFARVPKSAIRTLRINRPVFKRPQVSLIKNSDSGEDRTTL